MKPLYDEIKKYIDKTKTRYHMPGHNGNNLFYGLDYNFDITEVPGLDNLLQPSGVILKAEQLLAKDYNFKYALMVTCGSTISMQMSIFYARKLDYKIISIGQMHSSFTNTLKLHNIEYLEFEKEEELKAHIKKNVGTYAIFVTTPDYFGNVKNIDELSKFAHENNSIVIVDAAHGAHFVYTTRLKNLFPYSADIVFTSMHKTMPALGGSAVLFCSDNKAYETLCLIRQMCHTTSPNYSIMASIDCAREEFEKIGEVAYDKIYKKINSYKNKIGEFNILKNDDFSRLVLEKENCDAYKVLLDLQQQGIGIEMAVFDKLVFIITPYNFNKLDELKDTISKIETEDLNINNYFHKCEKSAKNIDNMQVIYLDLDDELLGEIAAVDISIYPPAIPILNRGEVIDKDVLNILLSNKDHLLGIVKGKIPVLK